MGGVTLLGKRTTLELGWTPDDVGDADDKVGLTTAAVEGEDIDLSGRDEVDNDGKVTVTVPEGSSGRFTAQITGPRGTVDGVIEY